MNASTRRIVTVTVLSLILIGFALLMTFVEADSAFGEWMSGLFGPHVKTAGYVVMFLAGLCAFVAILLLWSSNKKRGRDDRFHGSTILMTGILAGLMMVSPEMIGSARAGEAVSVVTTGPVSTAPAVRVETVDGDPVSLSSGQLAQVEKSAEAFAAGKPDGVYTYEMDLVQPPQNVIAFGCIVRIVVTIVIVAIAIYIIVKVKKFCNDLDKKRRQFDEDEQVPTNNPPIVVYGSRTAASSLGSFTHSSGGVERYAASFVGMEPMAGGPIPPEEECDCDPFRFEFVAGTDTAQLKVQPPKALVYIDEYLERSGLSTNMTIGSSSFSSNGVPVPPNGIISFENGMLTVNIPGRENVTTVVQTSTNMVDWIPISTNRWPRGAIVRYGDSTTVRRSDQKFWRTITVDEGSSFSSR